MVLLQERARLLGQRRYSEPALSTTPPPPPATATSVDLEMATANSESPLTEDSRKAARNARRHSPYSAGPGRRSSSPPILELSTSPTSLEPAQPSSKAPFLSASPEPAEPTPILIEEDLQFVIFDPLRKAGDSTSFEVSYNPGPDSIIFEQAEPSRARQVQIKGEEPAIRLRQAPYVPLLFPSVKKEEVDGELDMELETEDEDEEAAAAVSTAAETEDVKADPEPSIDIHHLDLLYTPARGKVWCRTCM